jgi:glycosyltransferase involved in cell wall biosynthesis
MLSVILLSYYSGKRILDVYEKIDSTLTREKIDYEFIIIDDGSKDKSFEFAQNLEKEKNNVVAYQLSRNYTSHYSIFAGLSVSKGDCAVAVPDDEQQPYELIVEMFRAWENGAKIVIPYRKNREDPIYQKLFANLFYFLINHLSDVRFPPGGADSFLIDREIIDIINSQIHPINTTSITEILRLGFEPYYLPFDRIIGNNKKSRWTLKKKFKLAMDTFYSCSCFPIKCITIIGLLFSLLSVTVIIFYLYIHLWGNKSFWGYTPPGWTSIILFISFFCGLILFSIGIIAEYIWRIYEEVKNRPGYIIKKKTNKVDLEYF